MKPRIHILDILRGILALSIMVYHYSIWTNFPWPLTIAKVINKFGYFGVIWFFVISGFSLAYSYGLEDISTRSYVIKFYIKRFLRIAPLFALASLVNIIVGQTNWDTVRFLNNAFLIFPFSDFNSYIPTGGWSIGIEVLFYTIFPALVFILSKNNIRSFFLSTAIISLSFLALSNQKSPVFTQGTLSFSPYYLMFFTAGMGMAQLTITKNNFLKLSTKKYLYIFIFFTIMFIINWPKSSDNYVYFFIYEVFHDAIILIATYTAIKSLEGTWISQSKILRTLGDWSYSIYLLHPVVYYLFALTTDRTLYVALLSLPSTFIACYLTYNYFELPIGKLTKKLTSDLPLN